METGMLHLHSILRWVILILLLAALYHAFARKAALKQSSLWLMIASHIMLVVGLYQLIAGRYGITKFKIPEGVELMKDKFLRFYWIEHPLMMFIAIVLITVARAKAKRGSNKNAGWLLLVALLLILAAVPWPFRDVVGETRTWFPGM